MQKKVLVKESIKLLKLLAVGFLLIIILVLAGEKMTGTEMVILAITPYILYQLYFAFNRNRAGRRKKK
jgi:ACR3 family arsenite efflux pump ArsB